MFNWLKSLRQLRQRRQSGQSMKESIAGILLPIATGKLFPGILVTIAVTLVLGLPIGWLLTAAVGSTSTTATVIIALMVGGTYLSLSTHHIPVGYRAAVIAFGQRSRSGPEPSAEEKKAAREKNDYSHTFICGIPEGWKWLPLPVPFMTLEKVDCRQKQLEMQNVESFTKDDVVAKMSAFLQHTVWDLYEYLGVENAIDTLDDVGKASIRSVMLKREALALAKASRKELSDDVETEITTSLHAEDDVAFGIRIHLTQVTDVRLPKTLEELLQKQVQEPIERKVEGANINARLRQQRRAMNDGKMSPDMAAAFVQGAAGEPGIKGQVNVLDVNVKGLEGMSARTAERVAGAVEAVYRDQTANRRADQDTSGGGKSKGGKKK